MTVFGELSYSESCVVISSNHDYLAFYSVQFYAVVCASGLDLSVGCSGEAITYSTTSCLLALAFGLWGSFTEQNYMSAQRAVPDFRCPCSSFSSLSLGSHASACPLHFIWPSFLDRR